MTIFCFALHLIVKQCLIRSKVKEMMLYVVSANDQPVANEKLHPMGKYLVKTT